MVRATWSMAIDFREKYKNTISLAFKLEYERRGARWKSIENVLRCWRIRGNRFGRLLQRAQTMHQLCPLANLYLFRFEFSIAGAYSMFHLLLASSATNNDYTDERTIFPTSEMSNRSSLSEIYSHFIGSRFAATSIYSVQYVNLQWNGRQGKFIGMQSISTRLWATASTKCANLFLFARHVGASLQKCIFYLIFMAGLALVSWTVATKVWWAGECVKSANLCKFERC